MMELVPFAPSVAVAGFFLAVAPALPRHKTWARTLVIGVGLVVCLRYLAWRLLATVCPADLVSLEGAWILFLFAFELVAFGNQFILHVILTRATDRTPEADRYEAELRRTPVEQQVSARNSASRSRCLSVFLENSRRSSGSRVTRA